MMLKNEIAIITGGASERGIGRGIAGLFAENGANVAIFDVDVEKAKELAGRLGPEHRGYRCDVTSRADVESAVSAVAEEMGTPSILVNNAGITQPKRMADISEDDYDAVLDVNLRGTFLCSRTVIPYMRKAGRRHNGRCLNIEAFGCFIQRSFLMK